MKWLLAPALLLGMNITAFAQIDAVKNITTEPLSQYAVTPNNLKANTGRLLLNFPTQTVWSIYVYKMSSGEYVTSYSNTNNPKSFSIAPGEYKITLNNAPITNISIKKGHDTRLRVGVLHVDVNDVWYLYDEAGNQYFMSGNKPATISMPVGKYLLKYGDIDKPVIVNESTSSKEERVTLDREKYIMVPIDGDGRLFIPKQYPLSPSLKMRINIYKDGDTVLSCGFYTGAAYPVDNFCPEIFALSEGNYEIRYSGVSIHDVEIRKGYETRLKMGYFIHETKGLFGISSENSEHELKWYDTQMPTTIGLLWPIGKYKVTAIFVRDLGVQEITDGKTTTLNPLIPPSYVGNLVVTTHMVGNFPPQNMGRLHNSIIPQPADTSINALWVRYPNSGSTLYIRAGRSHDLGANTYSVYLNGVKISVQIEPKHDSRLRVGYLKMLQSDAGTWNVHHATETSSNYGSHNGIKTIALPPGLYRLHVKHYWYLVKIKEDETLEFATNLYTFPDLW